MKKIEIGKKIKNFTVESTNKDGFNLEHYLGSNIVLFFYPKDNTPGCTQEGIDFSENLRKFKNLTFEYALISNHILNDPKPLFPRYEK